MAILNQYSATRMDKNLFQNKEQPIVDKLFEEKSFNLFNLTLIK